MTGDSTPNILIRSGLPSPTLIPITQAAMVLGRHPDTDIHISTPYVSRRHARIDFDGRDCTIRDLGSRNGTFVNGVRVDERPVHLNDRDEIRLGLEQVVIEFRASGRTPTLGRAEERQHAEGAALSVDFRARQVSVRGALIDPPLSRKEFDILGFLVRNAGRACTLDELGSAGWPERSPEQVSETEIRQYIRRIRKRIEFDSRRPQYLRTLHGYGYRLTI